jgi:hypothetical protein
MARNVLIILTLFASTSVCRAQENSNKERLQPSASQQSAENPPTRTIIFVNGQPVIEGEQIITLAPEEGSWAVQLRRYGGLLDTITSSWLINSQGEAVKKDAGATHSVKLPPEMLSKLTHLVLSAKVHVQDDSAVSPCRDCYTFTLVLYRREANGKQRAYTTSWDELTGKKLPEDIASIYSMILEIK